MESHLQVNKKIHPLTLVAVKKTHSESTTLTVRPSIGKALKHVPKRVRNLIVNAGEEQVGNDGQEEDLEREILDEGEEGEDN